MSEPKRWHIRLDGTEQEDADGRWVEFEDYDRLRDEHTQLADALWEIAALPDRGMGRTHNTGNMIAAADTGAIAVKKARAALAVFDAKEKTDA
jgi:hypothetical protein